MSLFRYSDHVRSFWAFFGRFWPLLANFGPKVKIVINWSYDHSKQSQDEQKSDGDGLECHLSDIQTIFCHFGPFSAIFGNFGPILASNSKLSHTSHVTTQNDRKRSRNPMDMVLDVILKTFRPFLAIFGHFRRILAPNSKLS